MLENGTWVVKNGDGLVMATWNKDTETWIYSPENIKVQQVIMGNDANPSLYEPFMGPLPPDDPATHFKDENGNPVGYGIGPEVEHEISLVLVPATEVFVRFRGVAQDANHSVMILEMPQSVDRSIIIVQNTYDFAIFATVNDGMIFDTSTAGRRAIDGHLAVQQANEQLIGHMVLIRIDHDKAEIYRDSSLYEKALISDRNAKATLDFLSGRISTAPVFREDEDSTGIVAYIVVPESQLPLP